MTTTYNTFTPPKGPFIGTSRKEKIRTKSNDFGDGYAQCIADGLNTHEQELSLEWDYLTATDADTIEAFFVDQNATPFLYTLPGESAAKKWRCVEWSSTYQQLGGRSITATLTKVII